MIKEYYDTVNILKNKLSIFEKVEVEINLGCNRTCRYCFLYGKRREDFVKHKSFFIDPNLYIKLLQQLSEINFVGEMNFHFYAEPLLHKNLHSLIKQAKDHLPLIKIVIYTNGDFLSKEKYSKLVEAGIDLIYITRHDDKIPSELIEIIGEKNIVLDSRSKMQLNNRAGFLGRHTDPRIIDLPCIYPSLSIIITIDGEVLPCSCDFEQKMSFGNIKDQHLIDIWNSQKAVKFRADLLDGQRRKYGLCKDCDYYADVLGLPSAAEQFRYTD